MKNNYRPLGTAVTLRIIPIKDDKQLVLLPEGQKRPGQIQTFEVVGIGDRVNDEKFSLKAGEIVVIAAHPSQMIGLDMEEQLMLIDREFIKCVVEPAAGSN